MPRLAQGKAAILTVARKDGHHASFSSWSYHGCFKCVAHVAMVRKVVVENVEQDRGIGTKRRAVARSGARNAAGEPATQRDVSACLRATRGKLRRPWTWIRVGQGKEASGVRQGRGREAGEEMRDSLPTERRRERRAGQKPDAPKRRRARRGELARPHRSEFSSNPGKAKVSSLALSGGRRLAVSGAACGRR